MKVSVTSYSFQRKLNAGTATQFSIIKEVADLGFDAIEFTDLKPHDGSTEAEYAQSLRNEAMRCGIEISSHTIGADLLRGSDGNLQAEIERVKAKVDIAEILGVKFMRHDASFAFPEGSRKYQGFMNALPRLAEGCRAITEYAASKGIKTMVENHGQFCQDSDRVELLVNTVAHENFGLLVDMGNFMCADENPITAVGRVAPYAFYAHAKDFLFKRGDEPDPGEGFFRTRGGAYLRGTVVGHGIIPVKNCLAALKLVGFDGFVSLEFEGLEDVDFALRAGLGNLRRYISEV